MDAIQIVVHFLHRFDSIHHSNQYVMFYDCVLFLFVCLFASLCYVPTAKYSTVSADKKD